MAWASTVTERELDGNRRIHYGTFSDGAGAAGGDIDTGLKWVEICFVWHKGAAVETDVVVVNETFPLKTGLVTIVCNANDTGYWIAIGL